VQSGYIAPYPKRGFPPDDAVAERPASGLRSCRGSLPLARMVRASRELGVAVQLSFRGRFKWNLSSTSDGHQGSASSRHGGVTFHDEVQTANDRQIEPSRSTNASACWKTPAPLPAMRLAGALGVTDMIPHIGRVTRLSFYKEGKSLIDVVRRIADEARVLGG
jgi:hypothetical protein